MQILMLFFAPVLLTGVYLLGRRRALRESAQRQQSSLAKKGGNTESQADGPAVVDQFLYDRCCRYMADRKPFLVESFSLGDLASVLFTNKVYLSKTINYYRVMYAMELFRRNKSLTVAELGSLAGFHSNTTFNQAFKTVMKESPSTWCARLRKKNRE